MSDYIGWVPTVGGRLSFSILGNTDHPKTPALSNVANKDKRYIICLQKRNLLDSSSPIFKKLMAKVAFGQDASFWCLLVGNCDNSFSSEDQSLKGELYLFHKKSFNDRKERKRVFYQINQSIINLNKFSKLPEKNNINDFYKKNVAEVLTHIEKTSLVWSKFELDRNGIFKIKDLNPIYKKTLDQNSDGESSGELDHIVCSQLFFFVKDVVHHHQHHHPKTDTILDIYQENGEAWECEVLRALYKKVLEFKRDQSEGVFSSALGVLAYVKAFKKVVEKTPYNKIKFASRDDETLAESIKASQDDLRFKLAQKHRFFDLSRILLLSVFGSLLTFSSLIKVIHPIQRIESNNHFIPFVADRIINHLLPTLAFLIIGLMSIVVVFNWQYISHRNNWVKDVARTFQGLKSQGFAGLVFIVFAFLVAKIAYFVSGIDLMLLMSRLIQFFN